MEALPFGDAASVAVILYVVLDRLLKREDTTLRDIRSDLAAIRERLAAVEEAR